MSGLNRGVIAGLGAGNIQALIDIRPVGGIYLLSLSEPFKEQGEQSESKINAWISRFELNKVHSHCSGQASGRDLREIVSQIGPKTLIPIHTEHASQFRALQGGKNYDCSTEFNFCNITLDSKNSSSSLQ